MENATQNQPTIVRTNRGLSIAGTRITIYSIMDYLKADWPPHLIRDWFNLTDQQIQDVLNYIEAHQDEVENEYQQVLEYAEELRQYWTERNQERFARIATLPPPPGREAAWAKLQKQKAMLATHE